MGFTLLNRTPFYGSTILIAQYEDIDMNRFDFTPYRRSTVGFDRLFDLLENNARAQQSENYPPFNIERSGEDNYRITLAVAGFKENEIEITAQQNLLLVAGNKDTHNVDGTEFLHMGIANRNFERRFELADFVRVENAALADGLLIIDLVREIPDAMKPQSIAINNDANVTKISDKRKKKESKAA
ncbi:MAG: Hsp20 family protein [Parasphingorhabdus sp.]